MGSGTIATLESQFNRTFAALSDIGRDPNGGWTRLAWTDADTRARSWFVETATGMELLTEVDHNGNQWAWWPEPGDDGVATGSHLDTVRGGGAYDGALGVVSGFLAIKELQRRDVVPTRPIAVIAFADEEGGRFNTPTFGSRLMTGALDAEQVRDRTDTNGVRLVDAVAAAGVDPAGLGADTSRLGHLGAFVELHIEQGRGMVDLDAAVALCDGIWPHGRWRVTIDGEPNHAGTTRLADRRDPLLVAATAVGQARSLASAAGAVATVGRLEVHPNSSNSVPGSVTAWLDARAATTEQLDALVADWQQALATAADQHGCRVDVAEESSVPGVRFDGNLTDRLAARLAGDHATIPRLSTGAGHDAGVLAAHVPSAMLLVRNPTGVSHSPAEHITVADCLTGICALADVLEELAV